MAVTLPAPNPYSLIFRRTAFVWIPCAPLTERTGRTRAVVPVHLYGMPARLQEFRQMGIPIIEDAAQAHGSETPSGAAVPSGYGGCIQFLSHQKHRRLRGRRNYRYVQCGNSRSLPVIAQLRPGRALCIRSAAGQNSRLDEVHAAILRIQLQKLDEWNRRRRQIAARIAKPFGSLPLGMQTETGTSCYHLFVVTTPQRDHLRSYLASRNIPAIIHYRFPCIVRRHSWNSIPGRVPMPTKCVRKYSAFRFIHISVPRTWSVLSRL